MTEQRKAFEKWMLTFHTVHANEEITIYDYSFEVWRAAQEKVTADIMAAAPGSAFIYTDGDLSWRGARIGPIVAKAEQEK